MDIEQNKTIRITKSRITNDTRGKLAKRILVNGVPTKVYAVPETASYSCIAVNIANFGSDDVTVVLWITDIANGTPTNVDLLEPAIVLKPGAVFFRFGILLSAGERLVAAANSESVVIRVDGAEDSII